MFKLKSKCNTIRHFFLNCRYILQHSYYSPTKRQIMAPSIPDRWIPYKACGKVIDGTRLICFKVPLRKAVQQNKPDIQEIWDITALLAAIPKLCAVIDLTNTARYYNPQELQRAGVLHKKIYMPGRIIPPEDKVIEFMDAVDEFLGKDFDSLVGVHCTHGLNRTGYMVCRYMRDRLGIDAKDAIRRFEIARGYKIERDNYVADLLGQKPPPPDVGNNTTLKPVSVNGEQHDRRRSPLHEDDRRSERSKYRYNGDNWRDECKRNDDYDDRYNGGRYVRHPDYNSGYSSRNRGESSRNRYDNNSSRRNSPRKESTDSDSSYDFRYDY